MSNYPSDSILCCFLTLLIWHVKLSERLGFSGSTSLYSSIFWLSVTSWARIYRFYCMKVFFQIFEKIHDFLPHFRLKKKPEMRFLLITLLIFMIICINRVCTCREKNSLSEEIKNSEKDKNFGLIFGLFWKTVFPIYLNKSSRIIWQSCGFARVPKSGKSTKMLKFFFDFFEAFLLFMGNLMLQSCIKMLFKFSHICQTTNGWSKHHKT